MSSPTSGVRIGEGVLIAVIAAAVISLAGWVWHRSDSSDNAKQAPQSVATSTAPALAPPAATVATAGVSPSNGVEAPTADDATQAAQPAPLPRLVSVSQSTPNNGPSIRADGTVAVNQVGGDTVGFLINWATMTDQGTLEDDNCLVQTVVTDAGTGAAVKFGEKSSACTTDGWDEFELPVGRYVLTTTVLWQGQTVAAQEPLTVDPRGS